MTPYFLKLARHHGFSEDDDLYKVTPCGEMSSQSLGMTGNRYLIRPSTPSLQAGLTLELEPGLCNVIFYTSEYDVVGKYEWFIAGGMIIVPALTCDKAASVDHLIVENICLA